MIGRCKDTLRDIVEAKPALARDPARLKFELAQQTVGIRAGSGSLNRDATKYIDEIHRIAGGGAIISEEAA